MIVELPLYGDYPRKPHSSLLNAGVGHYYRRTGGRSHLSYHLRKPARCQYDGNSRNSRTRPTGFQPDLMVYHDAITTIPTNEPTMDGTACLTYYPLPCRRMDKQAGIPNDKKCGRRHYPHRSLKTKSPRIPAADKADGCRCHHPAQKKHGIKVASSDCRSSMNSIPM